MTFEQALLALLAAIAVGLVVIAFACVRVGSLSERDEARPEPARYTWIVGETPCAVCGEPVGAGRVTYRLSGTLPGAVMHTKCVEVSL